MWVTDRNSQKLNPVGFRGVTEGFIDCFEAFKGCLLKKKFFKSDIFDVPNSQFLFADDVYFSGHIIKNGYSIFVSNFVDETNFIQDDVDALCANVEIRNHRMTSTAKYFRERYGIW